MYSNGLITAPVSVWDVRRALGLNSTDVGTLCTSTRINMWAKCKPINAPYILRALNYAAAEQIMNYKAGLSCIYATSFNSLKSQIESYWDNANYKDNGQFVAVKYDRPTGGLASPYRLTDFNGYNHNAWLDARVVNGSGQIVGTVSPIYSSNIIIDVRDGMRQDTTLPDDSTLIDNYLNWMDDGSEMVAREYLHIYDIINWQLPSGAFSQGLRRGILIISEDGFRWTSVSMPWFSDSTWMNILAGSAGKTVKVCEFYTNVTYAGGTENKTGTFICIPQFSYVTKCYSNANFSGTYPATTPSGYVEIFFRCDAPVTTFYDLFITLQINYNGSLWEDVQLSSIYQLEGGTAIRVRYGDTGYTDNRAVYENVYRIQIGDIGKKMRTKIWGRLNSHSETAKEFYTSEEWIID